MRNFFRTMLDNLKFAQAKKFWRSISLPGEFAQVVYDAIEENERAALRRILEFGSSQGGNLKYFMERLPKVQTVGIDINRVVVNLMREYPNYKGIVGDEQALADIPDNSFDLAFTVSVLDHISCEYVVEEIIGNLLRISKRVLLLEPYIEGVRGDVSGKIRNRLIKDFETQNKKFAAYSYFWDYDSMLSKKNADWAKKATPLYKASLGPFYHLYGIPARILNNGKLTGG